METGSAPGERVYMRVGDTFKDVDVIDKEGEAARRKEGGGNDYSE
jgi:hypothetical protein